MHDLFKKRRSVRKYMDTMPSNVQIKQILSAAMVSPSSQDAKSWEFVIVKNREMIGKLSKCGGFQAFVSNAPVIIVVTAKDSRLWVEDCSLAAGQIYLETANQGLGACWANIRNGKPVGGKSREEYVKGLLNIPEDYRVMCMMPIGYPDENIPEHSEDEYMDSKVHPEMW